MDFDRAILLQHVRERHPLVECLTNYVTVNDVANMILACGGSPVMGADSRELSDFIGLAQAVLVNVGTMGEGMDKCFEDAFAHAARLGKPVILDPVGAGAAKCRTELLFRLLDKYPVAVIRGNASEIRTLAGDAGKTVGVDAAVGDAVNAETLPARTEMAAALARQHRCVVAMSGAWDIITDGTEHIVCKMGCPQMSLITGTGCMLTGLTAAFVGANPTEPLHAAAAATELLCRCGEKAWAKTKAENAGLYTFRTKLLDEISLA